MTKFKPPTEQEIVLFDEARKIYPGIKRGLQTELAGFVKKHKDWREVLPLLKPAIEQQTKYKAWLRANNKFYSEWPLFKTWINQSRWEEELPTELSPKQEHLCACGCGRKAQNQYDVWWVFNDECLKKVRGW